MMMALQIKKVLSNISLHDVPLVQQWEWGLSICLMTSNIIAWKHTLLTGSF